MRIPQTGGVAQLGRSRSRITQHRPTDGSLHPDFHLAAQEPVYNYFGPLYGTDMAETDIVFVVDDDASLCELIALTLQRAGLEVRTFSSAEAFVDANDRADRLACAFALLEPFVEGAEIRRDPRRPRLCRNASKKTCRLVNAQLHGHF